MLHLRLITPGDLTDRVQAGLCANPVATNVAVLPAAARDPAGDVVLVDVAREAASEVIGWLRELGVEERGSITVEDIEVALSPGARSASHHAPGAGGDAIVWEELVHRTREEAALSVTYLVFFAVATMLAGVAVLLDSAILVVGAMIVGPEYGALAGLCTGVVLRKWDAIRRSAVALAVGFTVGVLATILLTWLLTALGLTHESLLTQPRPQTGFIYNPDAMSFVVAFLAGTAGMLALTTAKSGAIVGVLVSVTTIPAAGNLAVAAAYGQPGQAWRSFGQLLLNLLGILLAGTATLWVQRLLWRRLGRRRLRR